mgnify:CR=1 FL=1|jgi:hypothetical protein|tara:strand:- start:28 stop:330 length:303 start_codon:yes stop_codon:yes gene_type:complete
MGSKARHLADMIALGSRGKAVGHTDVGLKADKNPSLTRMGQNKNDDMVVANTSSGFVGIQTTAPDKTFEVNGDIKVTGELYDDSDRQLKVYYANGDVAWG